MSNEISQIKPRSEAEQVTRSTFPVALGSLRFDLTPKTIKASKAWKAQLNDALGGVLGAASTDISDLSEIVPALSAVVGGSDDMMLDLLAAYDEQIADARDEIEEVAQPSDAWNALMQIVRVEFPFLKGLGNQFSR